MFRIAHEMPMLHMMRVLDLFICTLHHLQSAMNLYTAYTNVT